MTTETFPTALYEFDIENLVPNYGNSSIKFDVTDLREDEGITHEGQMISFLELAQAICPEGDGDIIVGIQYHTFEEGSGPDMDYLISLSNKLNLNTQNSGYLPKDLYTSTKGKYGGTLMHPYLFVKFAMWLSTDFEVQVISWVYDNVIAYRNQAGDHYKEMCSSIQTSYFRYFGRLPDPMIFQQEARFINELVFGRATDIDRNAATEKELDLLNRLQLANIKLLKSNTGKDKRHEQLQNFATLSI